MRRLHEAVVRIFDVREIIDLVHARGSEIIASTPAEFATMLKLDIERYRGIMLDAGIQPQ